MTSTTAQAPPGGSQVSSNLRELRIAAGLSQSALARAMGVTSSAVSRWESGSHVPGLDAALALSAALGVTVEQLVAPGGGAAS